jgi:hypothetical protein
MLFFMEKIKKELKKIVLAECKDCELSIREIAAFFEKGKIGKKIHRRRQRRDRRKKRKSRRTTRFPKKTTISSRLLQGVHGGAILFFTQWKNALFTGSG